MIVRTEELRIALPIVVLACLVGFRLPESDPYVDRIVSFEPGEGAGFGQDKLPDIVLGPPRGHGKLEPSDHVLSLGKGGKITLESSQPQGTRVRVELPRRGLQS